MIIEMPDLLVQLLIFLLVVVIADIIIEGLWKAYKWASGDNNKG